MNDLTEFLPIFFSRQIVTNPMKDNKNLLNLASFCPRIVGMITRRKKTIISSQFQKSACAMQQMVYSSMLLVFIDK